MPTFADFIDAINFINSNFLDSFLDSYPHHKRDNYFELIQIPYDIRSILNKYLLDFMGENEDQKKLPPQNIAELSIWAEVLGQTEHLGAHIVCQTIEALLTKDPKKRYKADDIATRTQLGERIKSLLADQFQRLDASVANSISSNAQNRSEKSGIDDHKDFTQKLLSESEEIQKENVALKSQLATLRQQLEASHSHVSSNQKQIEQMHQTLSEQFNEITSLKKELITLKQTHSELAGKSPLLTAYLEKLPSADQTKVSSVTQQLQMAHQAKAKSDAEIIKLQKQLTVMESSHNETDPDDLLRIKTAVQEIQEDYADIETYYSDLQKLLTYYHEHLATALALASQNGESQEALVKLVLYTNSKEQDAAKKLRDKYRVTGSLISSKPVHPKEKDAHYLVLESHKKNILKATQTKLELEMFRERMYVSGQSVLKKLMEFNTKIPDLYRKIDDVKSQQDAQIIIPPTALEARAIVSEVPLAPPPPPPAPPPPLVDYSAKQRKLVIVTKNNKSSSAQTSSTSQIADSLKYRLQNECRLMDEEPQEAITKTFQGNCKILYKKADILMLALYKGSQRQIEIKINDLRDFANIKALLQMKKMSELNEDEKELAIQSIKAYARQHPLQVSIATHLKETTAALIPKLNVTNIRVKLCNSQPNKDEYGSYTKHTYVIHKQEKTGWVLMHYSPYSAKQLGSDDPILGAPISIDKIKGLIDCLNQLPKKDLTDVSPSEQRAIDGLIKEYHHTLMTSGKIKPTIVVPTTTGLSTLLSQAMQFRNKFIATEEPTSPSGSFSP